MTRLTSQRAWSIREHLRKIIDSTGRETLFTHDDAGDLVQVTRADLSTRSFGYDSRHLMVQEADARNHTKHRQYDDTGRLLKVILPDLSQRTATHQQAFGSARAWPSNTTHWTE